VVKKAREPLRLQFGKDGDCIKDRRQDRDRLLLEPWPADVAGANQGSRKAIRGDFDYFQVFLGAYIPIAFAQAVGDEAFADGMQYQVEVPPLLRNQFSETHTGGPGVEGATPGASAQIGKANWAWIISNTSLVVPVLLAAAILYVAFTKLNEWAGSERKAFERVIEFQAQAISEDRERFKLLFDELRRKPEPPPQPVPQPQRRTPKKSRKKKH
jgi:hypothetical protein